jgi:hypothetical protein
MNGRPNLRKKVAIMLSDVFPAHTAFPCFARVRSRAKTSKWQRAGLFFRIEKHRYCPHSENAEAFRNCF